MCFNKSKNITVFLNLLFFVVLGVFCSIFALLYISTFRYRLSEYNIVFLSSISISIITIVTIFTIIFFINAKQIIYKTFLITTVLFSISLVLLYLLKISGFFNKIKSVEQFRNYIYSFGSLAVFIFILCQFLQVVVLPIPSFITVGAGVLMFGPLRCAIYSCIGIIAGSLVAFFIGRVFGVKVVRWLIGEDSLQKGLKMIKGKDKIILTFMFLFPFFPDDVLCFVAGITSMSSVYFTVMIIIVRIICIFTSSYSLNNSFIPYNTWWGLMFWGIIFVATIFLTFIIYKKGEKIEKFIKNKFIKKNHIKSH